MRNISIIAFSTFLSLAAAGCALPTPDYVKNESQSKKPDGPPTVADLMHHIRCEIRKVTVLGDDGKTESAVDYLASKNYAAQITLSLKVEDTGGIAPNLSYITNHSMFSYLLDGNLSLDRQQTYSTSYVLDMKGLQKETEPPTSDAEGNQFTNCNDDKADPDALSRSLSGDLGIDKIIYAGRKQIDDSKYNLKITPGVFATQPTPLPNFGSTVQFMITKGFDTGPYWKIFNFAGPSTSSKGLISGSKISTDSVIVAFASVPPVTVTPEIRAALQTLQNAVATFNTLTQRHSRPYPSQTDIFNAKAKVDVAQAQYNLAVASGSLPTASAAVLQNFTTNIILQNLAGSLPAATH